LMTKRGLIMVSKRIQKVLEMSLCIRVILLLSSAAIAAENPQAPNQSGAPPAQSAINTDGGTGKYKPAIQVEDKGLPSGHTIFRPKDLSPFGNKNPLPILFCAGVAKQGILSEIASHGFLVLSLGFASTPGQQPAEIQKKSSNFLDDLDWAIKENARSESPYYQKIDTTKIAVAGTSASGLRAIDATIQDSRVTTTIAWSSGTYGGEFEAKIDTLRGATPAGAAPGGSAPAAGVMPGQAPGIAVQGGKPPGGAIPGAGPGITTAGNQGGIPQGASMPNITKDDLLKLHTPILYLVGSKDMALEFAKADFEYLTKVPVVVAIRDGMGHGEPDELNGGAYGVLSSAWLKWQLKADMEAAKMFRGKECVACKDPKWEVMKKNID
jgi:hypothetical protein